jgi:hypothetical protein
MGSPLVNFFLGENQSLISSMQVVPSVLCYYQLIVQNPDSKAVRIFYLHIQGFSGFGGLGVACWPLVPKFAGSNPAEAVGFLGRKNPQHAFLRRGSKAVGPMS